MKKKVVIRKYAFILSVLMILSVFMLSSCGVPEYNTVHESGTYKINSFADFEKLAFKQRASVEEVAHTIPDFCIYDCKNDPSACDWKATFYIDFMNSVNVKMIIGFNADKEFMGWLTNDINSSDFDVFISLLNLDKSSINYSFDNNHGTYYFYSFGNFGDSLHLYNKGLSYDNYNY